MNPSTVTRGSRLPTARHAVALYRPPAALARGRPWYTRQEIDTLPEAMAALRGREIAYLADPVDALALQIQGSGRLRMTEPDGRQQLVRLAFAGTNEQPYRSVGNWLLQQGAVRDASWPGIKAWAAQNPQRVNEMIWSNPRTVFFREEPLSELDAAFGPRGAQGVPLTPATPACRKECCPCPRRWSAPASAGRLERHAARTPRPAPTAALRGRRRCAGCSRSSR